MFYGPRESLAQKAEFRWAATLPRTFTKCIKCTRCDKCRRPAAFPGPELPRADAGPVHFRASVAAARVAKAASRIVHGGGCPTDR